MPYLFLNATRVETGQRAVLSPFALAGMPANCSSPGECFDSTIDLSEFAEAFKLSTALHLSARFPYLSPAGGISGNKNIAGLYVDGGYYDNSGALTAMDVADTIMVFQQTSKTKDVEMIIISIKNSPELVKHSIEQDVEPSAKQGFAELLSPIRTLLGMREERGAKTVNRMIDWAKLRELSGSAIFQMQYIQTGHL